jgi:hypothetical protein
LFRFDEVLYPSSSSRSGFRLLNKVVEHSWMMGHYKYLLNGRILIQNCTVCFTGPTPSPRRPFSSLVGREVARPFKTARKGACHPIQHARRSNARGNAACGRRDADFHGHAFDVLWRAGDLESAGCPGVPEGVCQRVAYRACEWGGSISERRKQQQVSGRGGEYWTLGVSPQGGGSSTDLKIGSGSAAKAYSLVPSLRGTTSKCSVTDAELQTEPTE